MVLIAVANGSCVKITTANSPSRNSKTDRDYTDTRTECSHGSNYQFSIDSWSSLDGKIIGQAFVFAFTMILCLSTALQLVYFMCMGPRNEVVVRYPVMPISGLNIYVSSGLLIEGKIQFLRFSSSLFDLCLHRSLVCNWFPLD